MHFHAFPYCYGFGFTDRPCNAYWVNEYCWRVITSYTINAAEYQIFFTFALSVGSVSFELSAGVPYSRETTQRNSAWSSFP